MKKLIYAYIAGLFDGEGTITLTTNFSSKKFRYPAVSVANTDLSLLKFIKKEFGGAICSKKKQKKHHSQSYHWQARYDRAIYFLKKIYPFLKIKEKCQRASLIINCYKKVTRRNGRYTFDEFKNKTAFEEKFFSIKSLHPPKFKPKNSFDYYGGDGGELNPPSASIST